jgi:hypothetical protein
MEQQKLKELAKIKKKIIQKKKLLVKKQKQIIKIKKMKTKILKKNTKILKQNTKILKHKKVILKQKKVMKTKILKQKKVILKQKTKILKQKIILNKFPQNWTTVSSFDTFDHTKRGFSFIDISPTSSEFTDVLNKLKFNPYNNSTNIFNKNVVKIERIQNPMAWISYYYRVLELSERSGIKTNIDNIFYRANEHIMKHGSSNTDPVIIASGQHGIDPRYCNKGMYGFAAYMAEDASYSNKYSYFKNNNLAQMFIAVQQLVKFLKPIIYLHLKITDTLILFHRNLLVD